jgi:hypothetical protein
VTRSVTALVPLVAITATKCFPLPFGCSIDLDHNGGLLSDGLPFRLIGYRVFAFAALVVSSADLLNLWRPIGAWEEHHSLAYGEGPRQTLDVYKPRHATKAPVVVFFYGGSWQGGSRDLYPFVGASKYCRRHCEAECVRSLEVDDQLALGRRLH